MHSLRQDRHNLKQRHTNIFGPAHERFMRFLQKAANQNIENSMTIAALSQLLRGTG
jgi:hypothetical protein